MKNIFIVENSDRKKYKRTLSFDDMIVWFDNGKYSVIAACYEPYDKIYRYIRKLFPYDFIVNNMLEIGAIG